MKQGSTRPVALASTKHRTTRASEVVSTALATVIVGIGILVYDWSALQWLAVVWVEFALLVLLAVLQGFSRDSSHRTTRSGAFVLWSMLLWGLLTLVLAWGGLVGGLVGSIPVQPAGNVSDSPQQAFQNLWGGVISLAHALREVMVTPWGCLAVVSAVVAQLTNNRGGGQLAAWDGLGAVVARVLALFSALALGALLMQLTGQPAWTVIVLLPIKCWVELTFLRPGNWSEDALCSTLTESKKRRRRP
jgi:hypothetical protein